MIETHTTIEIIAPHHNEAFTDLTSIKRLKCNYCNGTGEILHIDDNNDREFLECPCCSGTRFVDAVITIQFEPSQYILIKSKI